MSWQERYLDRFYDPEQGFIDGTTEFHELCAAHVRLGSRILDLGAGPDNATSDFLSQLGELHGADIDPDVSSNSALASAGIIEQGRIPFPDQYFDACVSDVVIEHVEDPQQHLAEVRRVIKPGSPYVFRTPNRYHYVALASAVTPHRLHLRLANRLRDLPQDAHDPYPTFYAMNTRKAIRSAAATNGFEIEVLRVIEKEPSYGMSSRLLFWSFLGYERLVNSSAQLEGLRASILGVMRSRGGESQ